MAPGAHQPLNTNQHQSGQKLITEDLATERINHNKTHQPCRIMTESKLGRLKDFLRHKHRSSNASNDPAARIPVPPQGDSSAASVSQDLPSSTHLRTPDCLTDQNKSAGSIHSVTPSRASSSRASPPETTVSPPQARQSLWDRAYEALRENDPDLLNGYEELLSKELPEAVISPDPRTRQDQLKKITDRGMERVDEKRTKYTIFGHEFILRDQVSQVAQFVTTMKSFVDEAIKVSPEASLAWAGVCVILPIFTNPSAAEAANRDGLSYVTSRIRYYVELERLLWPDNLECQDLRGEFEGHIVDLYKEILKFQIKAVSRFYEKWLKNLGKDVIGSDDWKGMVSKIKQLEQMVQDESRTVNTIASRKALGDIHDAAEQHDIKLQSLLSVAKEQLLVSMEQMEISSEQLAEHKRTNQILEDRPIDLPVVYEACYDSADVQDSPKCDDGTRTRIIDKIHRWAEEDESLLWLVGPAGTGKSTIARTVADSFAGNSRLVAGYFFKRGQQERNDTSRFFPTLAVQMTTSGVIPSFKRCLSKHLDGLNKDAVEKKALEFQFDKLFRLPLADLPPAYTHQLPMLIIIDALDECERPEHLAEILRLLSELRNITQLRLRVILTSRSAPSIADAFEPLLENKTACRLEIHREFFEDTKKDIRTFLEAKFNDIRKKCRVQQNPWPSAEEMDHLVQLATSPEPLFIYAATLCRFVYDEKKRRNPKKQLERWLERREDSKSQLDQIYNPILAQIFADNSEEESGHQLQFLGSLVLLANPLSASSLAALLSMDADDVTWWLPELHAVLDIPSESHKPLRLLHKSFSDFLLDSDGSSANPYRVDIAETHSLLAEKCVQRMQAGLRQDICDIGELDASPNEIGEAKIKSCIPEDLAYACLHWLYHLQGSGQPPPTYVHTFLHDHFLHWLEALSLLGRLSDGALAIIGLLELTKKFPDSPVEFVDLLKDAKRVILSFGSTIERAPLQTYGAVLFFSPLASKVRETFWNQRMPSWDAIQGVKQDWDAYLQSLEGHNGRICKRAMAFSPDSQVIAAGISDDTVQLWSTTTGATLQTLEGHAGVVEAVAFSNNETLASASLDGTIRIWHLPTGKLLHTLNHPHDSVTAMVFLPDGEHLATASKLTPEYGCEVSVRLWNLKTAAPPEELFQNSGHVFKQVVFSPDSQLMASNNGGTIEVWSFPAGSHRCTLEDPRGSVDNMVISPDNQFLGHISLTSTIRLWNIEDGQHLYEIREGYEEHLVAVAFTPDGRFLASASWSPEKVKMWDLETGAHHHTISGTESRISETVAFSPDSQLLATVGSSGAAIKLWDVDMQTQQHPSNVIEPTGDGLRQLFPSKDIIRVIYSPDGQLAATGAYDRTARLWDVSTGSCLRVLGDHDNWVHDVAFSPDGKLLASFDDSVRIWNVEDGTLQQNIDKKTGLIIAAEYSADGRLAAAASADTVTLYNAATGAELFTLEGHSNTSGQVVFSPDSQLLASVSGGEICLWETSTGMLRHVLRSERTGSDDYQLVFSPDSQSLASVHLKFTVLWDVVSGAPQQTLMYEVDAIAFSPDHQLVAMHVNSFGEPTVTEIRSVTTGKSWHTDETPDCLATDILFSPDGQILALAAKDRSVWLLGVTTHEHFVIIKNPHDFVTRLKFSPDGQTLATSSQDKTVRLWDTTTGAHIHVFEYGTGFVRGIDFSPEAGLVVSESSHEGAWSSNLFSPMTLKVHKFPLTTAARQIGTSEFHTPGISLDVDQDWIIKDSKRLLWLPTEYRPGWPAVWAKRGSMILIGCDSGQLLRVQGI